MYFRIHYKDKWGAKCTIKCDFDNYYRALSFAKATFRSVDSIESLNDDGTTDCNIVPTAEDLEADD